MTDPTRPSLQLVRSGDDPPAPPRGPAPILGIDLGTTHSLVSVLRDDGPVVLGGDQALVPSAVALDDAGTLLVGAAALARLHRQPQAGVRWFKRDMGGVASHTLGPHTLGPTELSALVLRELKARAEADLGQPVRRAVITVPAYFGEPQRAATIEAGQLADLEVVRLVNEPTAAAMAHGLQDAETERRCAVIDLGGGTLDVTLLDIYEGVVEILATGGDARLGGEDFTDLLWTAARRESGLLDVAQGATTPVDALLREECEAAKRALSTQERVEIPLPGATLDRWTQGGALLVSRALFATLAEPLTARIRACIADTLAAGDLRPDSVDEVLLVGGATRMPLVHDLVQGIFGKEPRSHLDPDTTVALGAAVQAGLIAQDAALDDLVVTDVLSHSLGVEISREGKDRFLPGYFMPVLHRNTTLPVRRVERVATLHPKQKVLKVNVYQGEHRFVSQNRLLGSFQVRDLPTADDGETTQAVDLAFAHDLNGLLQVEATVVSTGEKATLLIEQQEGRLSPEELERAREALQRLNVHPRNLLPNRLLLEHAQTRYTRLPQRARDLLDPLLLRFEDALERQHPEDIAEAAQLLEKALLHPALAPGPEPVE